jgi:tRNA nucleotidyltransferase (CCA-adding enzyme)
MIDFESVPNPQRRALEIVREVAREKDCRPYLVGGPVRDMLLGRPWYDVDLTLEDGTSTLARALAKKVDGRVRSFPQFLTYKVTAAGLPEIDITTARKERYRTPGALPAVTEGRLKDDLVRRDFSVNAIAVDLIDGSLHDPTGGEHDLEARHVRILHEKSFLDDPTRIFRAIRLAERLGFTLENETASRMREAVESGALETVSRERLWRELFQAMDEAGAPRVLSALNDQGAIELLLGTRATGDLVSRLSGIQRQLEANDDLDRYVLFTGALLRGTEPPVTQLEGAGFSQKRARTVLQIANDATRFEDALSEAKSDRQRFRLFKRATPELLSVVAADRPVEEPHVARYHEFRKFKLALRGNDLEVPGGPHVAKALERTREAVFVGEIAPEEARAYAREIAKKYLNELKIEN